jgi:hypothetical protein
MKTYLSASAFRVTFVALCIGSIPTLSVASPATDTLNAQLLETYNEVATAGNNIQDAVKALDALTSGDATSLTTGFGSFSKAVAATQTSGKAAAARATSMRDSMTDYFAKWMVEIDKMPDGQAKTDSQQRLTAVQQTYSKINENIATAADKFRPLAGYLDGIQDSLKNDLTSDGVSAVKDMSDRAHETMVTLHEDLKSVLSQIDETRKMLGATP